jgi:bifunctional non-homologous end joining protein LigD
VVGKSQLIIQPHTFRERRYAMKKHKATRLHYDLRLEWNGFLLSWAIPKGPDRNPQHEREAIEMEDHRSEYLLFEGVHRTGPIMLWDLGTWEPHPDSEDVESSLRQGVLRFILRAEKLEGSWTLARTTKYEHGHPVWLLRKDDDPFAIHGADNLLEQRANSINDERTLDDIIQQWNGYRKDSQQQVLPFHVGS